MTVPRIWREISKRYNLIGSICKKCNRKYFPERDICPACRRESAYQMEDWKFSSYGKIISYTKVYDGFFKLQIPYIIGLIELEDGVKLIAQIVDTDEVNFGDKVEMVFRKISEDGKSGIIHYGYKFRKI